MKISVFVIALFLIAVRGQNPSQCTNSIGDATCEVLKPRGYCTQAIYQNTYCYKTCNPSECAPQCTNLPQVTNGFNQPSGTSHSVGQIVSYACNAGYQLVGIASNVCQEDSTYKYDTAPECKEECPEPPMSDELSFAPEPPLINNSVIVYKCKENGAETVGEVTSTCVDVGGSLTWTLTDLPTCNSSRACPAPPAVSGDGTDPEQRNYAHGEEATYQCDQFRELVGEATNECSNGEWLYPAPYCVTVCRDEVQQTSCQYYVDNNYCNRADHIALMMNECRKTCGFCTNCSAAPTTEFVQVSASGPFLQGDNVTYSCEFGTLVGSQINVCTGDDEWVFPAPVCNRDCVDMPTIEMNGGNNPPGDSHPHGQVVNYTCNPGYFLLPPLDNTCMNNDWSEEKAGECVKICNDPPLPDFLELVSPPDPILEGVNVTFRCRLGDMEGDNFASCDETGEWGDLPTCNTNCTDPPEIVENGYHEPDLSTYAHGQVIEYKCDDGYFLLPPTMNRCNYTEWTEDTAATCIKICNDPPLPLFLELVSPPDPILEGVNVTFRCSLGVMEGDNFASCDETGEWGDLPTCITNCTNPPAIVENGYHEPGLSTYAHGQVIEYKCDDGYFLLPPTSNTCNYTEWTEDTAATCIKICDDLPDLDVLLNYDIPDPVLTGVVIVFNCSNGVLVGPATASCNATGHWSELPTCTAECGAPPNNATVLSFSPMDTTEGTVIQYQCLEPGTTTADEDMSECLETGEWSLQELPPCVLVGGCGAPPTSGELVFDPDQETYANNSMVTYTCLDPTDSFAGENTARCSNGSWIITALPICTAICSDPPTLSGITFTSTSSYFEGDVITYRCENSEEMIFGEVNTTCTDDEWSLDTLPTCRLVCDPPPTSSNVTFSPDKAFYELNEVVNYTCVNSDSVILTENQAECVNGSWTLSQAPDCTTTCGTPPDNGDLSFTPQQDRYNDGTEVTYSCDEPTSVISGTTTSQCVNEEWSLQDLPTCLVGCGPPPQLLDGDFSADDLEFKVGAMVNYTCNSGFLKNGTDDSNLCQANGQWLYTTVTLVECLSAKFLYVLDGNGLVDSCGDKETQFRLNAPLFQGGNVTAANFPNFFRQLDLATSLGDWLVSASGSQYAIHQHSGACVDDNDPNYTELTFDQSDYSSAISNVAYQCEAFNLINLLGCAVDFHFNLGTSSDQNVILLIAENVETLNSAVKTFTYMKIDEQQPTWNALFFSMTLEPSGSADYNSNVDFLNQVTCGQGSVSCDRFLGSIQDFTDQDIIQIISNYPYDSNQ